ncbi:MAG: T9SS type A sorting domain-containing protein [Flavobacteriaceae bacterium]|jgi:hypothetical protein
MKLKFIFILSLVALMMVNGLFGQNVKSKNLKRSNIGAGYSSASMVQNNKTYVIQQSIGQTSVIGTHSNDNYTLRQGFIQPDILEKIIDKQIPMILDLVFYPNPFYEKANLSFSEVIEGGVEVQVFDILGRLIISNKYQPSQQLELNLDLPNTGDYIIKVKANNKQFIKHILKGGTKK